MGCSAFSMGKKNHLQKKNLQENRKNKNLGLDYSF